MLVNFFIYLSQGFTEFWVKMVLYTVICSKIKKDFNLPGSLLEIKAHLLPILSCISNNLSSSSRLQSWLLMFLSRWLWYLYHLQSTFNDTVYHFCQLRKIPSPLFKKSVTIWSFPSLKLSTSGLDLLQLSSFFSLSSIFALSSSIIIYHTLKLAISLPSEVETSINLFSRVDLKIKSKNSTIILHCCYFLLRIQVLENQTWEIFKQKNVEVHRISEAERSSLDQRVKKQIQLEWNYFHFEWNSPTSSQLLIFSLFHQSTRIHLKLI